jgi:hypothetical protein
MYDFSSLPKFEVNGTLEGVDPSIYAYYMATNTVSDEPRHNKQIDENGVEHESWTYTFSPASSMARDFSWSTMPYVPDKKRKIQTSKLRKRQRRAVQRKHNDNHRYSKGNK